MLKTKEVQVDGYERVLELEDASSGLHGFIAVHNTTLGPSLGGVRMFPYASTGDALTDALRLAQGMTYKSAIAGIGLGGGKSVIIGNSKTDKTDALLRAFGRAVDKLKGTYICAEDVGTTTEDMRIINTVTPYVAALPNRYSSGDPSPFTAWGVYRGLQALAMALWGDPSLKDRTIAIQGLGKVGSGLANMLFWQGAKLILADLDKDHTAESAVHFGAQVVSPADILFTPCDLLAPCAMGAVFNDETIPLLKCKGIGGSANNQLLSESHGALLAQRDILYAPDYVINAGGVINVSCELDPGGYNACHARDMVNNLYDVLGDIFVRAKKSGEPTSKIADQIAEERLRTGFGHRQNPIKWK